MTPDSIIIASHAWFIREGTAFTSPGAGTVAIDDKPDAAETKWIALEDLQNFNYDPQSEDREVYAGTPGQIRLTNVKETKRNLVLTFTVQKLNPFIFEMLTKSGELDGTPAQQYNPLEGKTMRGWLKVQQYDDSDALVNTMDVWSHLKINGGVEMGDDIVRPQFTAKVLHSTLNTGQLE